MVKHILFEIKDHGQLEEVRNLAPSVVAETAYLFGMDWHAGENYIFGFCGVNDFEAIKGELQKYEEFSTQGMGFTLVLGKGANVEEVEKDLESLTKTLRFNRYCVNYTMTTDTSKNVDRYYKKGEQESVDDLLDFYYKPVVVAEVPIGTVLESAQYNISCYLQDPNEFERLFNCSLQPMKDEIDGFNYKALPAPTIPKQFKGSIEAIELK